MSFPRYPAYKPSGVEWLGEVPEHWEVKRVRRIFEIKKRIAGELGFDILSITQQGIKVRDPESNDGQVSMDYSKYQVVEPGDFAMNHMDLLTGYVDISRRLGVTSPDYRVFSIAEPRRSDPGYLLYIFQMGYRQKILYAYGQGSSQLGRWRLPTEEFQDWTIPFPSLEEHASIATFLDRETTKIDALIAEQQRLIELLQEKRQAVISHAVTKGLNPDAPMKDSGVEWLGEVPEHWSLARLKHAAKEKVAGPYGASLTKSMYTGAGYRVYGQQQVIPDNFEEGDYYIDRDKYEEMKRYFVSPGDVLISVMGTVGKVAVVPDFVEPGIINPRLVRYHLRDLLIPRFAQKLLLSTPFQEKILLEAKGATMDGLNMHILGDLPLPVPPRVEQEAILDQLHRSLASFDAMSSSVEESILLLKERRSALISAAVTGQIDVRGLVPEAVAA
jgi:type I restriction enzyme S subunit